MSHFSEGTIGVAVDPKQKTLSNFIVTEDATGRGLEDQALSESNSHDDTLPVGRETSFSSNTHGPCESTDYMDTPQFRYLDQTNTTQCHNDAETGGSYDIQIHDFKENIHHHDAASGAKNLFLTGASQSVEQDSSPGPCDDEPGSLLHQKESIFWLNDYQCSICGIEVPPSFVLERQEHFDFHLAEKLQDEESNNVNRIVKPKQRFSQQDQMGLSRKGKKHKTSPSSGKHIPIDTFFAKTSQNF